jgi:hypothetical protein
VVVAGPLPGAEPWAVPPAPVRVPRRPEYLAAVRRLRLAVAGAPIDLAQSRTVARAPQRVGRPGPVLVVLVMTVLGLSGELVVVVVRGLVAALEKEKAFEGHHGRALLARRGVVGPSLVVIRGRQAAPRVAMVCQVSLAPIAPGAAGAVEGLHGLIGVQTMLLAQGQLGLIAPAVSRRAASIEAQAGPGRPRVGSPARGPRKDVRQGTARSQVPRPAVLVRGLLADLVTMIVVRRGAMVPEVVLAGRALAIAPEQRAPGVIRERTAVSTAADPRVGVRHPAALAASPVVTASR